MSESLKRLSYDLAYTVFFPLTGNPAGFHHLLLAECVLRQFPKLQKIIFILSNGRHPDPTKEQNIVGQQLRLEILRNALQEFALPSVSFLAKVAHADQFSFKLGEQNTFICEAEFERSNSIPLAEHVDQLKQNASPASYNHPVQIILGDDLLGRMRNPEIFNDSDLLLLAENGRFLIAPREKRVVASSIESLKKVRDVSLQYQEIRFELLPETLYPWLDLSSTLIRQMAQAGHVLTCFLPDSAARVVEQNNLFRHPLKSFDCSEWEQACRQQELLLDQLAHQLEELLNRRANQQLPHTISIVETSTGGRLTAALAALPGISRHLQEGAILYNQKSKERLLGKSMPESAVTEEVAMQLAKAFQEQSQADFVLVETGVAGPSHGKRRSLKQGVCEIALATPKTLMHLRHQSQPFLTKKEHQLRFAIAALEWLRNTLEKIEESPTGNGPEEL